VQEKRDGVDEEGRRDLLGECGVLQHIRGHGGAEGVGYDDDSVEVVGREDLRDGETGRLAVERGASYPVADWEYLYNYNTKVRIFFAEFPYKRKIGQ